MHDFLRVLLVIWAVGYPVVSCAPLLICVREGAGGALVGSVIAIILGSALFVPWVVGLVILGLGVYMTRPTVYGPAGRWPRVTGGEDPAGGVPIGSDRETAGPPAPAPPAAPAQPAEPEARPGRLLDWQLLLAAVLVIGGVLVVVAVITGRI